MAEKVLQTKIALLCKSVTEWEAMPSYVPLKGEMCIATIPLNAGEIHNAPTVLFKVGDGTKTFAQLNWASALATDVYAWAKKANLDFADLNDAFMEALDAEILEKAGTLSTNFRIVVDESVTDSQGWKLQKSIADGDWTDVSSFSIDPAVFATVEYVDASISDTMAYVMQEDAAERAARISGDALKVDKDVVGSNGKARIFNEADGGGAKFEHNDGSEAYVGVNDGGKSGLMAQIYADVKKDGKWSGSRINVYNDKIYYTNKEDVDAGVEKNDADHEIATVGAVNKIAEDLDNLADIAKTGNVNDLVQTEGDILILNCNF